MAQGSLYIGGQQYDSLPVTVDEEVRDCCCFCCCAATTKKTRPVSPALLPKGCTAAAESTCNRQRAAAHHCSPHARAPAGNRGSKVQGTGRRPSRKHQPQNALHGRQGARSAQGTNTAHYYTRCGGIGHWVLDWHLGGQQQGAGDGDWHLHGNNPIAAAASTVVCIIHH